MMFSIRLFASIIFLLFAYSSLSSQIDLDRIKNELENIIYFDTDIDFEETPGFLVSIIDGDSSFVFGFGSYESESYNRFDSSAVFEIGSISKTMTASLITILEENNILQDSDGVNKFIAVENKNPRLDHITIKDLIQHTSGLPKLPKFFGSMQKDPTNPYAHYTKKELLAYYQEFIPKENPDFLYSHVNYALLELIIESATGLDYESALDKYLFESLEMQSSFVEANENNYKLIEPGFDRAGRRSTIWDFPSFAGSEGVKSTLEDLVMYAKAHIGISGTALDNTFERNHTPDIRTNFNDRVYVGTGWHVFDQKKSFNIISHSGKTGGHRAYISFVKETKTGVIILSNSSIGTQDLGLLVLRMINKNWKRKI